MWRTALRHAAAAADALAAARSSAVASSSSSAHALNASMRGGGALARRAGARAFAADAADDDAAGDVGALSPRVDKLVGDILALNLLEVAELTDVLQKRLGVGPLSFAAAGAAPAAAPAAAAAPADAGAAAAPAEAKTAFDVKLDGFDAAAKIKVIKEVRGATGLGLKEAKELVEKAPIVVKAGLKQADADELKAKLEAAGAKVVVE